MIGSRQKELLKVIVEEYVKSARPVGSKSLCKKFKEKTGMTVVQYMNKKRIERAKLLLKNQKNTLEQVAEQTGFSNANYLVRVFKKVTGQTVSEYRRKYDIYE